MTGRRQFFSKIKTHQEKKQNLWTCINGKFFLFALFVRICAQKETKQITKNKRV